MTKRVTISDVAKVSGVSIGTVSRVLNGRESTIRVSETTRQHVLSTARKLGYQPNILAAALRSERTGVIGLVVRDIREHILNMLVTELQDAAIQRDLDLLLGHAGFSVDTAKRQLKLMRGRLFDGLLLIGHMPGDEILMNELAKARVPHVMVARGTQKGAPLVNMDEAGTVQTGLRYLMQLGHRHIGFIGCTKMAGIEERLVAFRAFVRENGLTLGAEDVQIIPFDQLAAQSAVQTILQQPVPPTAIFCASDFLALGALSGARQAGCRVPDDLSVIGIDDIREGVTSYPPLTTLQQPLPEMAKTAIDLLIEQIESKAETPPDVSVLLPAKLIVRESCSPPSR